MVVKAIVKLKLTLPISLIFALFLTGCARQSEDSEIEAKLGAVGEHRMEHPHYPLMVFGDFGPDNQPAGISVDVYGYYVHETNKDDPTANVLSPTAAAQRLERTFERAILSAKSAEAGTPPPKPPLPSNPDWKEAPHPKSGVYTIVCQCSAQRRSFDIAVDGTDLTHVKPVLYHDAELVIGDGLKTQNAALKASSTPNGFTLCTAEILKVQQGSRGVEPHLMGNPMLLTPVDKGLALRGLDHSIQKLLKTTKGLTPSPATAHLIVQGPDLSETYAISLTDARSEATGTKAALEAMGSTIDQLNKKS